jgi:hypothetical protein
MTSHSALLGVFAVGVSIAAGQTNSRVTTQAPPKSSRAASVEGVDGQWRIGHEADTFHDTTTVYATLNSPTSGGGTIHVVANCPTSAEASQGVSFTLKFEYHAETDDQSFYEVQGTAGIVHVAYRFDSGEELEALAQPRLYKNLVSFVVGQFTPNAVAVLKLMAQWVPIDINQFLNAKLVRFQLPLASGLKGVVSIAPQDRVFQQFLSECKTPYSETASPKGESDAAPQPPPRQQNQPNPGQIQALSYQVRLADALWMQAAKSCPADGDPSTWRKQQSCRLYIKIAQSYGPALDFGGIPAERVPEVRQRVALACTVLQSLGIPRIGYGIQGSTKTHFVCGSLTATGK